MQFTNLFPTPVAMSEVAPGDLLAYTDGADVWYALASAGAAEAPVDRLLLLAGPGQAADYPALKGLVFDSPMRVPGDLIVAPAKGWAVPAGGTQRVAGALVISRDHDPAIVVRAQHMLWAMSLRTGLEVKLDYGARFYPAWRLLLRPPLSEPGSEVELVSFGADR